MALCVKCNKPFGPGKPIVKLLGKTFHKECVVCKDCNVPLFGKVRTPVRVRSQGTGRIW